MFEVTAKILITSLDSSTLFPEKAAEHLKDRKALTAVLVHFSFRMHRIGNIFTSGPKSFSAIEIFQ